MVHSRKEEQSVHKTALEAMATRRAGEAQVMLSGAFLFSTLPRRLLEVMD